MKIVSTLITLLIFTASYSQCDVSVQITSVGNFNFENPNWEYLDPYCEDNFTGTEYIDVVAEICATDTICENVSIWFGIEELSTVSTSSWSQFPCRSILKLNMDTPTQEGPIQIVSCISDWSWTDYSPFIDDDMSNNCDTTYINVIYCEEGCEGDTCEDPIQIDLGEYNLYDNIECIDEFGNENLEDDGCEISVENDMYFTFSTASDSICLSVETIDPSNLEATLQIQIWEVELGIDYCSAILGTPLYDACSSSGLLSWADFVSIEDSINTGVGQFIILIDGLNGDETEFYLGINQCSTPLILEVIEFDIIGNKFIHNQLNPTFEWSYNLTNWSVITEPGYIKGWNYFRMKSDRGNYSHVLTFWYEESIHTRLKGYNILGQQVE